MTEEEAKASDAPRLIAQEHGLWVLHKPAGYAVHRTGDESIPDLQRWAAAELDAPASLSPVHRLDRETSGVVLFATDPERLAEGGKWFAEGLVKKRYLALVFGRTRQKGIIRRPLQDARRGRPLEAVTRYRQLGAYGAFSYLEVRPETGRRHQIRKHLHGIGHAIVGDTRYRARRFRAVPGFPGRLWLHAAVLELPGDLRYESPLPPELAAHLTSLEERERGPDAESELDPGAEVNAVGTSPTREARTMAMIPHRRCGGWMRRMNVQERSARGPGLSPFRRMSPGIGAHRLVPFPSRSRAIGRAALAPIR